jgi:uroporphyrinogen decarboxylase
MAEDLGHAAVPIGGLDVGASFIDRAQGHESGAWYAGGTLSEPEQLRACPEPDFEGQLETLLPQRRQCAEAGRACWLVIDWCFDRLAAWMGLEDFSLECYDRPEFIHEAMQWIEARNQEGVRRVVSKLRPDFVLYNGDCAYKTGTMIDPRMIREFCFEPSKKTVDLVRDLGIPFAFHSDGKLDDVIPMLVDLGICAVHGCEKQANDLGHLVHRFGDSMVLCGNADVVFLKNATPDEVRQETLQMLEVGNAKGRFVAACNTSPQDYIPDENYEALCRTVQEYRPSGQGVAG